MIFKSIHILGKNQKEQLEKSRAESVNRIQKSQEHLLEHSRSSVNVWERMKGRKEVGKRGGGPGADGRKGRQRIYMETMSHQRRQYPTEIRNKMHTKG